MDKKITENCPNCGSDNLLYSKSTGIYVCRNFIDHRKEYCGESFSKEYNMNEIRQTMDSAISKLEKLNTK